MKLTWKFPPYLSIVLNAPFDKRDFEWENSQMPVGKKERRAKLKVARARGKRFNEEFVNEARARMAGITAQIAAEEIEQRQREEQIAALADIDDSIRIADKLADADLPALKKAHDEECRKLRKDIKRDRRAIEKKGKRLAADKLRKFKARR